MYKILLCLRYLRTRYIALASIISVMLGVATMIVVNSVMAGFSTEMRDRIHGILADVVVETNSLDGVENPERLMQIAERAAGEYIDSMTVTVEVYGMISFKWAGQWITKPVTLIGIDPEGKAKVGPLKDYLAGYQSVYEEVDGERRLVQPPLRSVDLPPDWELTKEAQEYRRRWVSRSQWFNEPIDDGLPLHDAIQNEGLDAAGPPGNELFGPPESPNAAANLEPDNSEDPFAQPDLPFSEIAGDPQEAVAGGETPDFVDPLQIPEFNEPDGEDGLSDEPQTVRLYVGIGLSSFPYENQETGKTEIEMMIQPGDDVKISTVTAARPPNPVHFNATVVDIFKSGMSEYDSSLVFCNLEELQRVRGMIAPDGTRSITSIQIKLKDYKHSAEVVERLKAAFPPGVFAVRTWEQKQGPLLAAVEVESAILNVLLFLIIAVAGFGILAIFFMIVVEKTRDIGILKALGASSRGVMSIFLSYGLALGIVGSGVGVVLGLLFVHYINVIEDGLTWLTGREVFPETIYYFPEIPTAVHPVMVFWVATGAIAIAVLASILPARRAAKLNPVEALRYE